MDDQSLIHYPASCGSPHPAQKDDTKHTQIPDSLPGNISSLDAAKLWYSPRSEKADVMPGEVLGPNSGTFAALIPRGQQLNTHIL